MNAQRIVVEDERPARSTRSARGAAERRRARTTRMRYVVTARIVAVVATLTLVVVAYLGLVGNVERMNYDLGRAENERLKLVATSEKLDDELARLRSRDRLSHIAAQLGMHESQAFASITIPVERAPAPPTGLALLARLR